jgi:hypothetical protein
MEKVGPLDGIKYNENNKDSQIGQVTPKKYLKKVLAETSYFGHFSDPTVSNIIYLLYRNFVCKN